MFLHDLRSTIKTVVRGRYLVWLLFGVAVTYLSVVSGFDTFWHAIGQEHPELFNFFIEAGFIGFIVTIALPIIAFALGAMRKDRTLIVTGHALVQSGALAWFASAFLKFFTGRAHPSLWDVVSVDVSRIFQFGFGEGGIFWGWPSSHATVACALAATLVVLYPRSVQTRAVAWLFGTYVTLGVSLTFHWFSDAIMGAILGTIIGLVVGRSFATMGRS